MILPTSKVRGVGSLTRLYIIFFYRLTYSCSRKTECGDRLPVLLLPETESRDCDDDSNHDNKNEDCDSDSNHDNKNENCSMPAIK